VHELLVLALIGLGTYAMRAAFLVMAHRAPPAPVTRLLPYVGPAVLAAIVVPAFVAPHGAIALFGGLAVWWIASWAVSAAGGLGLGPS